MDTRKPLITVFGSHNPQPGSAEYEEAQELGRYLRDAGFAAATGGYGGIMAAVLEGAGGGVGFTADIFTAAPNPFVTRELRSPGLLERIRLMIAESDGFIVLRGGTGTLLELAAVWEMVNKKMSPYRPIVCLGEFWRAVVATQSGEPTIDNIRSLRNQARSAASYVSFANDPRHAVAVLRASFDTEGGQ